MSGFFRSDVPFIWDLFDASSPENQRGPTVSSRMRKLSEGSESNHIVTDWV